MTGVQTCALPILTQGWGPRDLDGEKVARGRTLAKLRQCEHERSPPVLRRSPRGHDNRRGGGVSAAQMHACATSLSREETQQWQDKSWGPLKAMHRHRQTQRQGGYDPAMATAPESEEGEEEGCGKWQF